MTTISLAPRVGHKHVVGFSHLVELWVITRAVRHRFVFRIIIFWGVDSRSYADWLARRQYVINLCHLAKNEMWASEVCFFASRLYGLFERSSYHVQTKNHGLDMIKLNTAIFGTIQYNDLYLYTMGFKRCRLWGRV